MENSSHNNILPSSYADLPPSVSSLLRSDSDGARKIFVGGLSWQTTEDGLKHYFESKGMGVDVVVIMRDKITSRSRGFGFVTFTIKEHVDKAVNSDLVLDGRRIEAKHAIPKRDMDNNSKKIFVGGIPVTLSESDFKKHFDGFGKVIEAQVMTERQTGRSRGFGFVTFTDENVAKTVLKTRHVINGKLVEVKKAEPKRPDRRPIHVIPFPLPYFPPYPYHAPMYGANIPPTGFYSAPIQYDPGYFMSPYASQFLPVEMDHIYSPPGFARGSNPPSRKVSKSTERSHKKRNSEIQIPTLTPAVVPLLRVSPPSSPTPDTRWGGLTNNGSVTTRSRRRLSQPVSVKKGITPIGTPAYKRAAKTKSYDFAGGIHKYFQ